MRASKLTIRALIALAFVVAVAALPNITRAARTSSDLAAVRKATAKYHDVNVAIADGYLPSTQCAALPGVGGMGYHYVNPQLAGDLSSDPSKPEVLLYAPSDEGLKLVGVEYFQAAFGQPHPELFGQAFDGPMPGHEPGMPEHYDLHVWLWQHNPNGMFAAWNPSVEC